MAEDLLNARVIARTDLTDELAVVQIAPDQGEVAPFEPGQFCTIGLPRDEAAEPAVPMPDGGRPRPRMTRRAYSIASSAHERGFYELYLVLVKQGRLTPRLWTQYPGDRLWLDAKVGGHFTLHNVAGGLQGAAGKDIVTISTGTGLAPFMSMLRTHRRRGAAGSPPWRRFIVIHGARVASDLGYRSELLEISRIDPSVVYIPMVTREPEGSPWAGLRGRVQGALEPEVYQRLVGASLDPAQVEVLLCGNPAMIEAVRMLLEGRGFVTKTAQSPGSIHFERYW